MRFTRARILLVAFFALLQCFVPLLHAHAHEAPVGPAHVHIHVFDSGNGTHTHNAASEFKASTGASASIEVSGEYKHERFPLPIFGALAVVFLAAVSTRRRMVFPPAPRPAERSLFHKRPPATAPPVPAAPLI